MHPIDFRNDTFAQIRARLNDQRQVVYDHWLHHGPGTTRHVAERAGVDLLSFRPRTTELYQLGLVTLTEDQPAKGEGIYRARDWSEWLAWLETQQRSGVSGQLQLV